MEQKFIVKYHDKTVVGTDFVDVTRAVKVRSDPVGIEFSLPFGTFAVNFITGEFIIDGVRLQPVIDGRLIDSRFLREFKIRFRPIWFRQWLRSLEDASKTERILYLGWQFTVGKRNHKRILQIHENGLFGF